jgi:hypothetical protein
MPPLTRVIDPLGLLPPATRAAAGVTRTATDTASRTALALLERALASRIAADAAELVLDRLTQVLLDTDTIDRALDSPQMTALAERILDSEGMERLVAQVLDSRLLDESVARVLSGDALWLVVDEIAQSPAVTEAITHQGVGFADQVADDIGARTRRADARLERVARRLLRRRARPDGDGAP